MHPVTEAAEFDDATERIIRYLNDREVATNVVSFQVFQHGVDQFLSCAWMIDPVETQANVATAAPTAHPTHTLRQLHDHRSA